MIETMMKLMIRARARDLEKKKGKKSNHLWMKMVSGTEMGGLMASGGANESLKHQATEGHHSLDSHS